MSRRVSFETPEDVALRFEAAGPGSRVAAGLIDLAILGGVLGAILGALIAADALALSLRDLVGGAMGGIVIAMLLGVGFGMSFAYFILFEWLLDGQSPGKRIVGLRVVRDGGYALTLAASIVRNVARVIDMLPGPYLVGLVSVLLSSQGKRLGDYLAGTLVVRHAVVPLPERHFPGERYSTLAERSFAIRREQLQGLPPSSLGVLDGYFDRREALAPDKRDALAARLAASFAEVMGMEVPEGRGELFLKETYLALRERAEALR